MLTAAVVFLVISIIAGALGLGRTASVAANIAQAIFGVFLLFFFIFIILFLLGVSIFR